MGMPCGICDTEGEDRRVRTGAVGFPHLVVIPTRAAHSRLCCGRQASLTPLEEATAGAAFHRPALGPELAHLGHFSERWGVLTWDDARA
jgi:hypothetical protein